MCGQFSEVCLLLVILLALCGRAGASAKLVAASRLARKARSQMASSNYKGAEASAIEALELQVRVLGAEHPAVAVGHCILAEVYCASGRVDKAREPYRKALSIIEGEKWRRSSEPDVATACERVAEVCVRLEEFGKAEELHGRACSIWRQVLGGGHPRVARSKCNLANVFKLKGDHHGKNNKVQKKRQCYEKAESLYREAIIIRVNRLGSLHPSVAEALARLSDLYRSWGEAEKEEAARKKANEMLKILGTTLEGNKSANTPAVNDLIRQTQQARELLGP